MLRGDLCFHKYNLARVITELMAVAPCLDRGRSEIPCCRLVQANLYDRLPFELSWFEAQVVSTDKGAYELIRVIVPESTALYTAGADDFSVYLSRSSVRESVGLSHVTLVTSANQNRVVAISRNDLEGGLFL